MNRAWGLFFKSWSVEAKTRIISFASILGVAATLLGFAGFTIAGKTYAWTFLIGLAVIVLFILLTSRPALPKSLKQIAEQDRKLATLNEVVGADYIFGILGLKNAGKTTFIKNVLNLPNPKQETPAPYYRLTPVQTRQGLKWAVFIDGPGDHKGGRLGLPPRLKN